MFPLTVDSLDKVQEGHKPYYEEREGKFHLKKELADLVKKSDVTTEFSKIVEEQNAKISRLNDTVEKFTKTSDVNSILKDVLNKKNPSTVNPDADPKAEPKTETKENPEIVVLRKQNADLVSQLKSKEESEQKLNLENKVKNAIQKHGGVFDLLHPVLKDSVALKDGEVVVINESGQVKFSDKTAKQMTLDELIESYKTHPTFKTCFKDGSVQGPNINEASSHTQDLYNKNPKLMTADEKIKVISEKGKDHYTQLLVKYAETYKPQEKK